MKNEIISNIKKVILFTLTIIVTFCMIGICSKIVQRKESKCNYFGLFEHKKDIDVLFVGTSHVVNGIQPLDLYEKYGITSFNLGTHGSQQAVQYWTLVNALDYVTPKVVVIDCYYINDSVKVYDEAYSWVHTALDAFPLSISKVKAAVDITSDISPEIGSAFDIAFDYNTYHNRWNSLERADFDVIQNANQMMGASMRMAYTPCYDQVYDSETLLFSETENIKYLKKMLDTCKSHGITVVLSFLPCYAGDSTYAAANTAGRIAEEYNIEYINFLNMDLVDYGTDFSDEGDHLNPLGALKVSNYIGRFLEDRKMVEDRRNEEKLDYWNEMIERYTGEKTAKLIETEDILLYLMLLQTEDYMVELYWNNTDIWECYRYRELFGGLGISREALKKNNVVNIENATSGQADYRYDAGLDLPEDIRILVYSNTGEFIDMVDLDYVHAESGNEEDCYCAMVHSVN